MRSVSCVAIALTMACACAAVHAATKILFARPVNQTINGSLVTVGEGMFVVHESGSHLRPITPYEAGSYYIPSGISFYTGYDSSFWLSKNFSPDGHRILYFAGQSSTPNDAGPYAGKYYTMDLHTGQSQPLFAGDNDNAAPGYAFLAWGPASSDQIAYTTPIGGEPVSPACVYLMNKDGSNQRSLWCAPAEEDTPQGPQPTRGIEAIRWAGNGQSLLAYVAYKPEPVADTTVSRPIGWSYSALYQVDVQTGMGILVADNLYDPPVGDVSYDGTKVLFQRWDLFTCDDDNPESFGASLCMKDMTTGVVTSLFKSTEWNFWSAYVNWWSRYWDSRMLLSPDGSQAAFTMQPTPGEADLYVINTDGTNIRRLSTWDPNGPNNTNVAWIPVAWSPDGTKILANRGSAPTTVTDTTVHNEVHVFDVSTGKDKFVTDGQALDWYVKP